MGDLFGIIIVRPFGIILMYIYQFVQSYGLAVMLFALLAKVILSPIAYKSKKSMRKMTAVQGQMKELQAKYANNKVKLNEEITKLYEREGVSPMGGCLPTLIQMPILMGLYYAVQKPLTFMIGLSQDSINLLGGKLGLDMATVVTKSATYQLEIAQGLNQFLDGAGHLTQEITGLAPDIASYLVPINFNFFGLDLSATPSIGHFNIIWLIPVLSGATAFLSTYLMQKIQGTQMQGSMKSMMYIMPLFSVYLGFILPASIGIYWITNNILTMFQELILTKWLNYRHPILSDEQKRELEKEEKRREHEEKLRAIENGETPVNPNTSRKKRVKQRKK